MLIFKELSKISNLPELVSDLTFEIFSLLNIIKLFESLVEMLKDNSFRTDKILVEHLLTNALDGAYGTKDLSCKD